MENNDQQHPAVLVVLLCQIACLTTFAFAEHLVRESKWIGACFGFSFLFGFVLSIGFFGMWRKAGDEIGFLGFLLAHPIYLAVVIATAGEVAAIMLAQYG